MRILHGITEAAGQSAYSVKGLKELGLDAQMAIYADIATYLPPDHSLKFQHGKPWLYPWYFARQLAFTSYAARNFDIFHFHYAHTLLINELDLPYLKRHNKKIYFEFHGTDLRLPSIARQIYPHWPDSAVDEKKMNRRNAHRVAFADGVILHDEELIPHLPEHDAPLYLVPLRTDPLHCTPHYPEKNPERIVIAHAPSVRATKGTEHIIAAVERLADEHAIDFLLIENTSHEKTLEMLQQADIVIDQLLSTTYGVFSIEAMAVGKPVITSVSDAMRRTFPESLPLVSATPDTVATVLKDLILDETRRNELGRAGRLYATTYHDYRKIAVLLKRLYEGAAVPQSSLEAFHEVAMLP
jgi:glycosyltransferase involved in cell wall biosynthesis